MSVPKKPSPFPRINDEEFQEAIDFYAKEDSKREELIKKSRWAAPLRLENVTAGVAYCCSLSHCLPSSSGGFLMGPILAGFDLEPFRGLH